jgi:hypothetical protein
MVPRDSIGQADPAEQDWEGCNKNWAEKDYAGLCGHGPALQRAAECHPRQQSR